MPTAEVFESDGVQAVKLPEGFRFNDSRVSIRRKGRAVILEPIAPAAWPEGFFEAIRIDDPTFQRPPQGEVPPAPMIEHNG